MALRGSIDVLSHRRIVGWAWETDAPETPVAVLIAIDRRVLGRCKADLFREDLAVHGGLSEIPCVGGGLNIRPPWPG